MVDRLAGAKSEGGGDRAIRSCICDRWQYSRSYGHSFRRAVSAVNIVRQLDAGGPQPVLPVVPGLAGVREVQHLGVFLLE